MEQSLFRGRIENRLQLKSCLGKKKTLYEFDEIMNYKKRWRAVQHAFECGNWQPERRQDSDVFFTFFSVNLRASNCQIDYLTYFHTPSLTDLLTCLLAHLLSSSLTYIFTYFLSFCETILPTSPPIYLVTYLRTDLLTYSLTCLRA